MPEYRMGLFRLIDPPVDDPNHDVSASEYLDLVLDAYRRTDFPWHRLIPGLRSVGRDAIDVRWVAQNPPGAVGTYTPGTATILLGYQFGASGMPFTFVHEAGHAVDWLSLSYDLQYEIMAWWHGFQCQWHGVPDPNDPTKPFPWAHEVAHNDTVWRSNSNAYPFRHHEAFADAFVAAFAPDVWAPRGVYGRFVHQPVDFKTEPPVQHYDEFRALVLKEKIMAFTDVPENHPHRAGIEWAAGEGLVAGYADGTFRPENPVNRGQLCTVLRRQAEQNSLT